MKVDTNLFIHILIDITFKDIFKLWFIVSPDKRLSVYKIMSEIMRFLLNSIYDFICDMSIFIFFFDKLNNKRFVYPRIHDFPNV